MNGLAASSRLGRRSKAGYWLCTESILRFTNDTDGLPVFAKLTLGA